MPENKVLLRPKHISKRLNISKNLWLHWVRIGKAPAGIRLSPRVLVWYEEDVEAFIANAGKVEAKQ